MNIYNFARETGLFLNSSIAFEDPLSKGKYILPAFSTIKEPLFSKDGFAVCFDTLKQMWEYKEDNRNKTVYSTVDKTESKVDYLGVIKDGFTLLKPNEFDKWITDKWIEDIDAKNESEKLLRIAVIDSRFKEIESEKIRPMSAITKSFLNNTEPEEYDVAKFNDLEFEVESLRVERAELLK